MYRRIIFILYVDLSCMEDVSFFIYYCKGTETDKCWKSENDWGGCIRSKDYLKQIKERAPLWESWEQITHKEFWFSMNMINFLALLCHTNDVCDPKQYKNMHTQKCKRVASCYFNLADMSSGRTCMIIMSNHFTHQNHCECEYDSYTSWTCTPMSIKIISCHFNAAGCILLLKLTQPLKRKIKYNLKLNIKHPSSILVPKSTECYRDVNLILCLPPPTVQVNPLTLSLSQYYYY